MWIRGKGEAPRRPTDPVTTVLAKEAASQLRCGWEALDEKDPEGRLLLQLHYLQGLTLKDLASLRGVSRQTISRRVHRSLSFLRASVA